MNISAQDIESNALWAISANMASHYNIVPLKIEDGAVSVATCDPFKQRLRSELELVLAHSHPVRVSPRCCSSPR